MDGAVEVLFVGFSGVTSLALSHPEITKEANAPAKKIVLKMLFIAVSFKTRPQK
jgi:hypothetical protein